MSVTIDLSPDEIALIRKLTQTQNDAEAISKAAREFLRLRRLQELKTISGNVDYENNWQELEAIELAETDFPQ